MITMSVYEARSGDKSVFAITAGIAIDGFDAYYGEKPDTFGRVDWEFTIQESKAITNYHFVAFDRNGS